jgi:hypothetical protein
LHSEKDGCSTGQKMLFRYSREAVAAVAERYTLQSQTLLSARTCGFESHPPHHFASASHLGIPALA